jgi:hypothetical protein
MPWLEGCEWIGCTGVEEEAQVALARRGYGRRHPGPTGGRETAGEACHEAGHVPIGGWRDSKIQPLDGGAGAGDGGDQHERSGGDEGDAAFERGQGKREGVRQAEGQRHDFAERSREQVGGDAGEAEPGRNREQDR